MPVPVPCTAWSNPTVRGLGTGVGGWGTGMGCWETSAVTRPLAEVRAVRATLGPPTVFWADSQADAAFFFSSKIFNP